MGRQQSKANAELEEKVRRLKELRALRTPSVPSKRHTKKPTGNDWTLSSLKGVPGGGRHGGASIVKMIAAARTGTRTINAEKVASLPQFAPPTTSFAYVPGGFQRVD